MILSKYVKNVTIRWDKDILPERFKAVWNSKIEDLPEEKRENPIISEVLILQNETILKITLPQKYLI